MGDNSFNGFFDVRNSSTSMTNEGIIDHFLTTILAPRILTFLIPTELFQIYVVGDGCTHQLLAITNGNGNFPSHNSASAFLIGSFACRSDRIFSNLSRQPLKRISLFVRTHSLYLYEDVLTCRCPRDIHYDYFRNQLYFRNQYGHTR